MKRQHFFWLLGAIFTSSFIVAACTDDSSLLQPEAPASESATAAIPSSPLDATYAGSGQCMGNDAAANSSLVSGYPAGDATAFNCTANDISLANARTTQGGPIQCVPGETFNVDIVADIMETATSERTDIGIWIANDGGDAEDGSCDFFYFGAGDIGTDPATEPVNLDGDQCGDMNDAGTVEGFPLSQLTLTCPTNPVVIDGQTFIEIASCVSWTQPGGDRVCPVDGNPRAGTLPANKSKCNCDPFLVEVEVQAQLTLNKVVVNDNGGTAVANDFQAKIDGSNVPWNAAQTVSAGMHTASETTLPSYTAGNWGGDCAADGSITLALDQDAVCTITNDDIPQGCEAGDRLTSVSLQLTGNDPNPINIGVSDDNGPNPTALSSSPGLITTGTMFTIVPDGGTFFDSQNLRFMLNGNVSKDLKVHLSCSDDPMVGDTHSGTAGGASATLTKTGFSATQF